jgi:hypothetical protein
MVVTPAEFAQISEGKLDRSHALLDDKMREYNRLENCVMARLMTVLNQGFTDIDIRLKKNQWFGPGQASQRWMGREGLSSALEVRETVPWLPLLRAKHTYFGGWFEIFMHGPVPKLWEYDINSAYPYQIKKLPCLLHGKWEWRRRDGAIKSGGQARPELTPDTIPDALHSHKRRNNVDTVPVTELPPIKPGQIRMVYGHVRGSDPYIGAMLHRYPHGSILRPSHTIGWFWQHELQAAMRAGVVDTVELEEWYTYTPCDCFAPLRRMANLYEQRLAVGKDTPQGKSAKLTYNSAYGKLCQQIGQPKYSNFIYASLITAGCRTQILDAIATHPEGTKAVAMIATDAVFFTSPHLGLTISDQLGDWDSKERYNMTLFKPGVYWDDEARENLRNEEAVRFKARGVNAKDFSKTLLGIDEQFAAWNGIMPPVDHLCNPDERQDGKQCDCAWPKVEFPVSFSMITCLQALRRGKWFLAGAVGESSAQQFSAPTRKRESGSFDGQYYRSSVIKFPETGLSIHSTFYGEDSGVSDEQKLSEELTPDGTVGSTTLQVIGIK